MLVDCEIQSTDGLLLAHGHFAFILKEFLKPSEIASVENSDIESPGVRA